MKHKGLFKRLAALEAKQVSLCEVIVIWPEYQMDCDLKKAHGDPVLSYEAYMEIKNDPATVRWIGNATDI